MRISNAFPSKFLKSSDLMGRSVRVIMDRIEMESLGEDKRPVIYFRGKEKGLVLNKTNANTIAEMWGDDTDHWQGKEITLRPTRVDFKGERVDAIRVEFIQPPVQHQPAPTPAQPQHDERNPPPHSRVARDDMNDEIPF